MSSVGCLCSCHMRLRRHALERMTRWGRETAEPLRVQSISKDMTVGGNSCRCKRVAADQINWFGINQVLNAIGTWYE